jgi:Type ISP C-terminal specificity domain/N-6 DNA Methylase
MATEPLLLAPLQKFGASLTANFSAALTNPAQPEDQLKPATTALLENVGSVLGRRVVARTEAVGDKRVRPDIGVSVDSLLAGHVELKAPGKGARPAAFSDPHDKEQFKKLRDHPNLVYTDGNEWALFRYGSLAGRAVRASGDVRTDGPMAYDAASATALEVLLRDFLAWQPIVPSSPPALAQALAPLARLLREAVRESLEEQSSALAHLADDWRDFFFPDADDAQFADAYAQTLTYALLLARVEGETDLHSKAPERLDRRHSLLAQVLRIVTEPEARNEVDVPVDLLERTISAVDPAELMRKAGDRDIWLYFYEDFLAAYDKKLRKNSGVYFTPPSVVAAQVTLVSELLRTCFDKELGFASDGVTVLDPAVGTGTYLLAAMQEGLRQVRQAFGQGAEAARASVMAASFFGFELLVASYVVSHLRLTQQIREAGGALPEEGTNVYLTDTLEAPHLAPQGVAHAPLFMMKLAQENERARRVKTDVRVLVCIGNPPYFRQVIEPEEAGVRRLGGWVREEAPGEVGIIRDFQRDTPGVHVKNLYNLYVFFWRWSIWKVFEQSAGRGIISFITASSYLRGPGFAGMRRHMRETFDDLWILDLGGEGRGPRPDENVFEIQTPVAIAIGVRYDDPDPERPAQTRYARVDGTRAAKYDVLRSIERFGDVRWEDCFAGWTEPLLPKRVGDYFSWPSLTDIFPWQHSGAQFKRTWPIAPDRDTLERRWYALIEAPEDRRAELFRETRDRTIRRGYSSLGQPGERLPAIASLPNNTPPPPTAAYAYRSLDRQYVLADTRLADFLRPPLWRSLSARQLFMTSLLTEVLGTGPAAIATNLVPDLHAFRGSFGGKHVIPLWRDAEATDPNVTPGLLKSLGDDVSHEDLFAYCYAVLSAPSYTTRFAQELEIPGPRIPLTRIPELFQRVVAAGERLIWLHTYCQRFVPVGSRIGEVPQGAARSIASVPTTTDGYPTRHWYDETTGQLHVGEGVFAPVAPTTPRYEVSGLDVIGSWLDYRMRDGAGRRSSRLDEIRPAVWTAEFTEELLRLLWIVEHTVEYGPTLDNLLNEITRSPVFRGEELPRPSHDRRVSPA